MIGMVTFVETKLFTKLVQQYPTRFGLFAAMPLPDVDATLKEIAYCYDILRVDGVGLFTSYGDKWLGDAAFRPAMEELNRRKMLAKRRTIRDGHKMGEPFDINHCLSLIYFCFLARRFRSIQISL